MNQRTLQFIIGDFFQIKKDVNTCRKRIPNKPKGGTQVNKLDQKFRKTTYWLMVTPRLVRDQGSLVDVYKRCMSWPWSVLINEIGGFGQNPLS